MSKKKSQKKYVASGQFQGETAVVTREVNENTVMVELIDFHTGKSISDEGILMSKSDLEDM